VFLAEVAARRRGAVDFLDLLLILRGEGLVGFVRDDGMGVSILMNDIELACLLLPRGKG
jgi:hypothetical protein